MAQTIGEALVSLLAARGVRRMFGVPGGDCNLDIIDAGARAGIEFVLTRTEGAAAIMAAITGELTGAPGVVMTTRGPGLASAVNGVAYASLDRAPLLLIADAYEREATLDLISHQRIDQAGILRPLLRGEGDLEDADALAKLEALLDATTAQPAGPVYLEIVGPRVRAVAPALTRVQRTGHAPVAVPDPKAVETARRLLGSARRPAIIAGLQAREPQAAAALRDLVTRWDCAVFTTYKAKGVASDTDPRTIGHYIGGASEEGAIKRADLILLYGFDPVEHPPGKWRYSAPVIELTRHRFERHVVEPTVSLVGDLAGAAEALRSAVAASEWTRRELAELRDDLRRRAEASEGGPIAPQHVVEAAIAAAAPGTRITVDAGAHMLPVLHLWRAEAPSGTLLSRGLSTMGFALPAAIGAALAEPDRPTIAFTGDGGLMMCLGELGTAVQNNSPVVVIVFNDSSLTLIGAKQRRRQLPQAGVDFAPVDFARVARGFGCAGWRVETLDQLRPAIAAAIGERRPAVVDVVVNPAAYHAEIISLRG